MYRIKYKFSALPIYIAYYIYPVVGLIFLLFGFNGGKIRDLLWIIPVILIIIPLKQTKNSYKFKKSIAQILFITIFILIFKFLLGFLFISNWKTFYFLPYLLEIKGWIFVLVSIVWLKKFGIFSLKDFQKGAFFLSVLYIVYSIYLLITGNFHRFGLGSESNYDGVLILLGYIVSFNERRFDKTKIILSVATFLTFSVTGLLSWLLITLFNYRKEKKVLFFILLSFYFFLTIVFIHLRSLNNLSSLRNADRILFWLQGVELFKEASISHLLFGFFPGIPIHLKEVLPGFDWYIQHFNFVDNIRGVHAFIFHGFWLRSSITFGLPFALLMIYYFGKQPFLKKGSVFIKGYSILILIQGFSLALFQLVLVGIPLILFFLLAFYSNGERVVEIYGEIGHT